MNSTPWAVSAAQTAPTDTKQMWKARKEEQAQLRKRQNDLKKTENEIASLEEQDRALNGRLTDPEVAVDPAQLLKIHEEKEAIRLRLENLYELWETLADEDSV